MSTDTMTTEAPRATKVRVPLHGINTPALFATIDVVRNQPQLAKFQFRANGEWLSGTHMQTTMSDFSGAGGEHNHQAAFTAAADHPSVLCGADHAPTPVEYLLHALAACVTAGVANIAAARGVTLKQVRTTLAGDMDLRGILGLSDQVRNGFETIQLDVAIQGDAPDARLREIVQQACDRSAVLDVLRHGTSVSVETTT